MLAEPSFNSKEAREKAVELLFEKYDAPGQHPSAPVSTRQHPSAPAGSQWEGGSEAGSGEEPTLLHVWPVGRWQLPVAALLPRLLLLLHCLLPCSPMLLPHAGHECGAARPLIPPPLPPAAAAPPALAPLLQLCSWLRMLCSAPSPAGGRPPWWLTRATSAQWVSEGGSVGLHAVWGGICMPAGGHGVCMPAPLRCCGCPSWLRLVWWFWAPSAAAVTAVSVGLPGFWCAPGAAKQRIATAVSLQLHAGWQNIPTRARFVVLVDGCQVA